MDETLEHLGAGRTTTGALRRQPPFAGVSMDRESVQRALSDPTAEHDFRGARLDGAHLEDLDFSGCQFGPMPGDTTSNGARLYRASAVGAHLNRCRLTGTNLRYADLREAVLEDAEVSGANFSRADLSGASIGPIELSDGEFSEAILERTDFCDAQLPRANMSGARLSYADLGGTDLTGADLYTTTLDGAFFGRSILAEANLCDAHGERVLMQGAVLTHAKVSGASLPYIVLRDAHLEKTGLDQSNLAGGDLAGAFAKGASLHRADLSAADCRGVNFSDANLQSANLRRADLRRVIFSADTRLAGATFAGALLHGIQWRGVDLSETDLRDLTRIGDEAKARSAPLREKPELYHHAAEAYGSLSATLRQCGLARASVSAHYRSALMDQRASKYEFITRLLFLAPPAAAREDRDAQRGSHPSFPRRVGRFLTSPAHFLRWFGTMLLGAVAGYGDAPWRALVSYAVVVTAFAAAYLGVSAPTSQPLGVVGSLVMSLTSFHGRGFNGITIAIQSPVAELSALEAMLGAFIELLFVAAFTRRFLGSRS